MGGSFSNGNAMEERTRRKSNIAGQRFGRLTALYPTDTRDGRGYVIWHCRCDCGTELELSYNRLCYSNQRSCGCQKREHDRILNTTQARVDGTTLHLIGTTVPKDNTTGVRGVYHVRGRYMAKLVFQKKVYYLGTYDTMDEAARARKDAEDRVYGPTRAYHARYQARAAADPAWAEAHPMQIHVEKGSDGLEVTFSPEL